MFNRLWSLLYYSGEHADDSPIEMMNVGCNQAIMLLTSHAGRTVVLYRDGLAVRIFQLEGFFLVPKSIPRDPRINCMRTIRTQPPSGARIAPPRVGAVREANHHCNLVKDPETQLQFGPSLI